MIPRDLQAAKQAQPQEQAFQDSNVFQPNGIGFQGAPDFEPYQIGQDYNGLASLDGLPQGVGIGVESEQEGLMRDALSGVYPGNIQPYNPPQPVYDTMGYDSQQDIVTGAIPVSLSGDRMYVSPIGNLPVGFHDMANTHPEIATE